MVRSGRGAGIEQRVGVDGSAWISLKPRDFLSGETGHFCSCIGPGKRDFLCEY